MLAIRPGSVLRRGVVALLLPVLLAAGCATTSGETPSAKSGPFGSLLPRPLGTVTFEKDPAVFVAGWVGMVAGGAAGGGAVVVVAFTGGASGSGDAIIAAVAVGMAAGAVVGGLLVALPVRGLEALWDLLLGGDDDGEFLAVPEEPPPEAAPDG